MDELGDPITSKDDPPSAWQPLSPDKLNKSLFGTQIKQNL